MSTEIRTAEELEALPVGSVVLDRHRDVWQLQDDTDLRDEDGDPKSNAWASVSWISDRTPDQMFGGTPENASDYSHLGPFVLLYRPDAAS